MAARNSHKQKILIVDDSEMNRSILADMLGEEYSCIEAANGQQAIELMSLYGDKLGLVLLDIVMPVMDGLEVLKIMNERKWIQDIPVIIISADNASDSIERAYELGATDYIRRPFDVHVVRRRALNTIMLYGKQRALKGMIEENLNKRQQEQTLIISVLGHIIEFRNGESGRHVTNVRTICEILLNALSEYTGKYDLSPDEISLITMASVLHDVGKISIDSELLARTDKLSAKENEVLKSHTLLGAEMLDKLPVGNNEPLVKKAYEICRWHHERWDGNGYPDGLKGEEIPLSAQVVGLADAYDTLTGRRAFKEVYSHSKAVDMILSGEYGSFNPVLLEVFRSVSDKLRTQLRLHSLDRDDGVKSLAESAVETDSVSSRTLDLLDAEREKNRFILSHSNEILFEVYANPVGIRFSDESAKRLGVKPYVTAPATDADMINCFGKENVKTIEKLFREATREKPSVCLKCAATFDGKQVGCTVTALKQYIRNPETGRFICSGAVGKIDVEE